MRASSVLAALLLVGFAAAPGVSAQVQQLADSTFLPVVESPAFTARHPKVLFDEAHNNFHRMNGRYQAFAALLTADGCVLEPNREPFRARTLEGHDLLVIANAAGDDLESGNDSTVALPAFTAEEVKAVHEWVSGGGALLLIADHAPFGSAAEILGQGFGVDMSLGFTADSLQAQSPGKTTFIEFTRERGSLGAHPIMEGRNEKERIDKIVAFTGQSLRGPEGSTPMMILSDAATDLPPDARKIQDRAEMLAKSRSAKGRCMAVALEVGKGRVVIQGEAAMLAAQVIVWPGRDPQKFGMNEPGLDNQQYALNVVRWLVGAGK